MNNRRYISMLEGGIQEEQIHGAFDFDPRSHIYHNLHVGIIPEYNMIMPIRKKEIQLSNLKLIFEAVRDFSTEAGIVISHPSIDKETIVIESGHQPNFLPHCGFWKKLFLLSFLKKKFHEQGKKAIALFGFADYNLCTAKLLTQNKLPAFNKLGFESIGFKISGEDKWKRFDYLEKPDENSWKKEMGRIVYHYKKYPISPDMESNLIELMGIMEECYSLAKNFPDLNAFLISRICNNLLGLDIGFFRYSDIQKKRILLEEWERIIYHLEEYNSIYNDSIKSLGLDIPLCTFDSLPFWYHCSCGAKVNLLLKEKYAAGRCRICSKDIMIGIEELEENYGDMSPNAVARNIIFSDGMGTDMFISGSGGGLRYGKISDRISRQLGFSLPATVSWKSGDYYIGPVHAAALYELGRICGIGKKNIGKEDIGKIIEDKKIRYIEMISKANEGGDIKSIKKYQGQYANLSIQLATINAIYKITPSFMDVFVSHGARQVLQSWEHALEETETKQMIVKNVSYSNDITGIYKKLDNIGD